MRILLYTPLRIYPKGAHGLTTDKVQPTVVKSPIIGQFNNAKV